MNDPTVRGIRRAAVFVGAGLSLQLFATLHWTPLTFVIFAMVGTPLVLVGVVVYARAVLGVFKDKKVL